MDAIFILAIFIIVFGYFGVWLSIRPYLKANHFIEKWANENGFKVLEKKKKFGWDTGPYAFGGCTAIHQLVVLDKDDKRRKVWTKTGSYFWPFSNSFKVYTENIWTEPPPTKLAT